MAENKQIRSYFISIVICWSEFINFEIEIRSDRHCRSSHINIRHRWYRRSGSINFRRSDHITSILFTHLFSTPGIMIQHLQRPPTAAVHIARRSRPTVVTQAEDSQRPVDRKPAFHALSMMTHHIVVTAVYRAGGRAHTHRRQNKQENYLTKSKRLAQIQRYEYITTDEFGALRRDACRLAITSTFCSRFLLVLGTGRTW